MTQKKLLLRMRQAVIDGMIEDAKSLAEEWLGIEGSNPIEAVEKGLTPGINEVGRLYEDGVYFLPELIASSEAMKAALNILRPAITSGEGPLEKGVVLMATIEGDIHEIGKSIVSAILEAHGFRVFDLGANVKLDTIYKKIKTIKPDVVGLSALLTTTMVNQKRAVEHIQKEGYDVKVIVGGAPVTRAWAEEIGADGYGKDAFEAAEIVQELMHKKSD